jgi:hypothetical protein
MRKLLAGLIGIVMLVAIAMGVMSVASGNEPESDSIVPKGEATLYPAPAPGMDGDMQIRTNSAGVVTVNIKEFDAKVNTANELAPPPKGHYFTYSADDKGNPVRQLLCKDRVNNDDAPEPCVRL